MRYRFLALFLAVGWLAQAETWTVDKLQQFIRSSLKQSFPDKDVAQYLAKVQLSEKLDDPAIENLQALGIGPKTLHALWTLRDNSARLPAPGAAPAAPAPAEQAPPPSAEEQGRIIQEAREYAVNYAEQLPDFICSEVVKRSVARKTPHNEPEWRDQDNLLLKLSYFQKREQYKLIMINDRVTSQDYEKVGGAKSFGDFGSMMLGIFEPSSQASFEWARWSMLRKRPVMVFHYYIDQPHSRYEIKYEGGATVVPAYSGLVLIDKETHQILRVTVKAENIPGDFPIKSAETLLDYDYADLSGKAFLLPLQSSVNMTGDDYLTRNVQQYRIYRKYSADSTLSFGDEVPPPLDESKTKEEKPGVKQ